jgi:hypothetical protein
MGRPNIISAGEGSPGPMGVARRFIMAVSKLLPVLKHFLIVRFTKSTMASQNPLL